MFRHPGHIWLEIVVDATEAIGGDPPTKADDIRLMHHDSFEDVKDWTQEWLHEHLEELGLGSSLSCGFHPDLRKRCRRLLTLSLH